MLFKVLGPPAVNVAEPLRIPPLPSLESRATVLVLARLSVPPENMSRLGEKPVTATGTLSVPPSRRSSPGPLICAPLSSVRLWPIASAVIASMLNSPALGEAAPMPPTSSSVPLSTLTLPSFSNGTVIVAVPAEVVRLIVPVLWFRIRFAPPKFWVVVLADTFSVPAFVIVPLAKSQLPADHVVTAADPKLNVAPPLTDTAPASVDGVAPDTVSVLPSILSDASAFCAIDPAVPAAPALSVTFLAAGRTTSSAAVGTCAGVQFVAVFHSPLVDNVTVAASADAAMASDVAMTVTIETSASIAAGAVTEVRFRGVCRGNPWSIRFSLLWPVLMRGCQQQAT